MIPIRDNQPSNNLPVVTLGLIGTNLLIYLLEFQVGMDNSYFYVYGLVPAKYTVREVSQYFSLRNHFTSLLSYMFLHGGFWHFLGNMWSLYIFGDNIEDHFGSLRFLAFYMICGLASGLVHFFSDPFSTVPTIGASGAIAGVMGAYLFLYPRSKILTLIPIIIIPLFVEIPAFIFLGFWFLMQSFNAAGSQGGGGIAWWAHIGGFIAGFALVQLDKRVPGTGTREKIERFTQRKHTPKLQAIVPEFRADGIHRYGQIEITTLEALVGAKKLITIPWGFYSPLYRVTVPPGVKQGTKLRLARMGRAVARDELGDLFLTVQIKDGAALDAIN